MPECNRRMAGAWTSRARMPPMIPAFQRRISTLQLQTWLRPVFLVAALSVTPVSHKAFAEVLVNLDATQLPAGPLETWINTGTMASNFTSAGAQVPLVANIAGVNAVQFIGTGGGAGGTHYAGPVA